MLGDSVRTDLRLIAEESVGRAEDNIDKWGVQDADTLTICIAEETGEIARGVLGLRTGGAGAPLRARLLDLVGEAVDLAALCLEMGRLMRDLAAIRESEEATSDE